MKFEIKKDEIKRAGVSQWGLFCLCVLLGVGLGCAEEKTPETLRVFQFNIWQEGTSVPDGFNKMIDIIIASKADVITLSEVRNYHKKDLHQRMINALKKKGYTFYGKYIGGDAGLLSKFPIVKTEVVADFTSKDRGCLLAYTLQLSKQRQVIVCSAHLDYKNFAIYLPRGYDPNSFKLIDKNKDGKPDPVTDINYLHKVDMASTRDDAIDSFLVFSKKHTQDDVILAGDFNECSHLDWTEKTKNLYSHHGVVIEWRNSKKLQIAGFTDSFREIYPDPLTHWGATWPSNVASGRNTTWAPLADERDRIDFIYYNKKRLQAKAAFIAGSKKYYVFNQLKESKDQTPFLLKQQPWMTDHKGVIVDFKVLKKREARQERRRTFQVLQKK